MCQEGVSRYQEGVMLPDIMIWKVKRFWFLSYLCSVLRRNWVSRISGSSDGVARERWESSRRETLSRRAGRGENGGTARNSPGTARS